MEEKKDNTGLSRRDFIKAAGVTAAGVVASSFISDRVLAATGGAPVRAGVGANDRINVAFIGIGGMGSGPPQQFQGQRSKLER